MEEVAIILSGTTIALLKYKGILEEQLIQRQNQRISSLEEQTKGIDQRDELLKQFIQSQSVKKPTGWLYIGTTPQNSAVNHFKVGITTNLLERRSHYSSTFSTPATRFFYCDFWELHDPKIVENASKVVLKSYHLHNEDRTHQDETYIINYAVLNRILSLLCTNHTGVIDLVNTLLNTYKDDILRPSIIVEKQLPTDVLRIEMKITAGDQVVTIPLDLDEMSEIDRVNTCKSIINNYVRAKTEHKEYDIATDEKESISPKIKIDLTELEKFIKENVERGKKGKVKMTAWRSIVTATLTGIKNIDLLKRKPRTRSDTVINLVIG